MLISSQVSVLFQPSNVRASAGGPGASEVEREALKMDIVEDALSAKPYDEVADDREAYVAELVEEIKHQETAQCQGKIKLNPSAM